MRAAASALLAVVLLVAGYRVALARIRMLFSEPVEVAMARLDLVSADGASTRLRPITDPRDVNAIIAAWIGGLAWCVMHLRTDVGTALRVAARVSRVAFGAHHRMRGLPWLRKSDDVATLRATLRRELVVMGIVLLLGGALSSTALPEPSHAHVASHFQHP